MAINLASLNVRGLRDSSKCARLLGELKKLCVDAAGVQETHFTCDADCRVLENDFNVFSAYGSYVSAGVSLLVGRRLDADVDVVFAGDWKFNTSLLEIRNFRDRLESLIQRALVGAVTGNRWWVSLKYRIRDFATKYSQQLKLDKAKEAKSIDDRLSRVAAGGDSLGVELA